MSLAFDGIMDPDGKYPNPLTGKPYSNQYFYHSKRLKNGKMAGWQKFKPWEDRMEIFKKLYNKNILLAKLPAGTGKTVILPKLLLHYFGYRQKIICTTPKQATTSSAAEYAALCLDVPLFEVDDKGNKISNPDYSSGNSDSKFYETRNRIVGYKYKGKSVADKTTKLLFLTDGFLKQIILTSADPTLSEYGGVVIDEAHERSINIDIIIALLLDIIPYRPDFKVIIMSATLDLPLFVDYIKRIGLGNAYAIYEVKDAPPPFERPIIWLANPIQKIENIVEDIIKKINEIILNPELRIGNILAFVTSDPEAQKIVNRIKANMDNYPVNNKPFPIVFTKNISANDKDFVVSKNSLDKIPPSQSAPQGYHRKVILGTNAVESSITFEDDIVYVIESGLAYEKIYNPEIYCFNSGKLAISQGSAIQRCGRTGRTCAGICYKLYTKEQYNKFKEFTSPSILTSDFTKELLSLVCLPRNNNITNALGFLDKMIQPVKDYKQSISRAYKNILNMNLIDLPGNIQPLGHLCNSFSAIDIKIVKMCIGGYYLDCVEPMLIIGAILITLQSFDDIFDKPYNMDKDPTLAHLFNESLKTQYNTKGDHITLLTIYHKWMQILPNDRKAYAKENYLNNYKLTSINNKYKELQTEYEKHIEDINTLNLFSITTNTQFGGYSRAYTQTRTQPHTNTIDKNNIQKGLSNINISELYINDDINDDINYNGKKKINKSKTGTQYTQYTHYTHIGKSKGKNKGKHKGKQQTKRIHKILQKHSQAKQNGGDSSIKHTKFNKYKQIIDSITFKGSVLQYLTPPTSLYDKIMSALFFGFSNNIGCFTGDYNKYYVKYSPKLGGIGDSIYDFYNISPPMIMYNEFICTKQTGRMDEYKLNFISELKLEHITLFLDLHNLISLYKQNA